MWKKERDVGERGGRYLWCSGGGRLICPRRSRGMFLPLRTVSLKSSDHDDDDDDDDDNQHHEHDG